MASTPIAVLSSDNHLQERAWHSRQELCGDSLWAFRVLVDYAVEHQLPLFLAGDVIDKQRNGSAVPAFLRRMIARLERAGIPLGFIQGQHERQTVPWLTAQSGWAMHLETKLMAPVGGYTFFGIDWRPKEKLPEAIEFIEDDVDVLLMHQVAAEWMGSITNPELCWEMIPGNVKLLLIGDYHDFSGTIVRQNAAGNDMTIVCPGSAAMQSITEPPRKYFYVLHDDLSVEAVEVPSRIVLSPPTSSTEDDLNRVIEQLQTQIADAEEQARSNGLPDELLKPILRVSYVWDLPDAYWRLKTAVDGRAHLFVKELRPKEESEELVLAAEAREQVIEGGLAGALPQLIDDTESEEFFVADRLLRAADPRGELMRIREEYLEFDDSVS